jgi:hypothetical protein
MTAAKLPALKDESAEAQTGAIPEVDLGFHLTIPL